MEDNRMTGTFKNFITRGEMEQARDMSMGLKKSMSTKKIKQV